MRLILGIAILSLALSALLGSAAAQSAKQVPETFTVFSRMLGRDATFKVDLDVPEGGNGPFPAVILMHGCGGMVRDRAPQNWRRAFREMGVATMIVESFSPRAWPANICTKEPEISWQGQNDRTAEAFGAARVLRSLPFIRKDGIVLMGFSHGAGTVLFAAHRDDGYWSSRGYGHQIERFDALIANYPWCGGEKHAFRTQQRPVETPLLILIGDSDNYTPTEFCVAYEAVRGPISNGNVSLKVYPNTLHSFDSGLPQTVGTGCGGPTGACGVRISLGHSDAAFERARRDVAEFLKSKIGLQRPQ